MSSSWFAKPAYKQVRYFSLVFLTVLFLSGFASSLFWIAAVVYLVLWGALTAYTAYRIESGYYCPTVNFFRDIGDKVCITFDDGPCEQTSDILDVLESANARASFFCVGEQVERFPDLTRRIVEAGHTIGNHSFFHQFIFPAKSSSAIRKEINATQISIARITGQMPRFFRPPFGVINPLIAKAVANTELTTVGWSIRSLDTLAHDHETILKRIEQSIVPGSIILLHDRVEAAAQLLENVLHICRAKNLQPISLDEALGD